MRSKAIALITALVMTMSLTLPAAAAEDGSAEPAPVVLQEEESETDLPAEQAETPADPAGDLPAVNQETDPEAGEETPEEISEENPEEISEEDEEVLTEEAAPMEWIPGGADNEDLFAAYVETQLGAESAAGMASGQSVRKRAMNSAIRRLSPADLAVYKRVREEILKIAAGERSSTSISIPLSALGTRLTWTAEDLGVSAVVADGRIVREAQKAVWARSGFDLNLVVNALLSDCPYQLYWYDKTSGTSVTGVSFSAKKENGEWKLTLTGEISMNFCVASAYAVSRYETDTSVGRTVQASVENARRIVSRHADASDHDKLCAYRDEICALTGYNAGAADGDVAYGDPWQLIWVFDGDPSTDVVCEGYSKAFKYLCDLSEFRARISCITVTGTLSAGTGAGGHMWNVVTMDDGLNYLTDITNSDTGTVGAGGQLFLAGTGNKLYSGETETGAVMSVGSREIRYVYDEDTLSTFEQAQIRLAETAYQAGETAAVRLTANVPQETWLFSIRQLQIRLDGEVLGNDACTVTSSDPAVVRILRNKAGAWYLQGLKTGTVSVTITAADAEGGEISEEIPVLVMDDRRCASNKYTIAFKGNGATSGRMSNMKNVGYRSKKTLPANAFKRKGYRFKGWCTTADGKGVRYANKDTVVALTSRNKGTVNLYAQWEKINYKITYNLNGGTNHASNPASYTVTGKVTFKAPTRANYTFGGWYSDKKFKKKVTSIAKGSTGARTLYARWTANKYKITFAGNGATSGTMKNMTGIPFYASRTLTGNAYRKRGYSFAGWNTRADGTGTAYANKDTVSRLSLKNGATVRLYAQWRINNYKINYNLNGGINNEANPETYTILQYVSFKRPTRDGYRFVGWYSDRKCTKKITSIAKGSTGSRTLYAKWEAGE